MFGWEFTVAWKLSSCAVVIVCVSQVWLKVTRAELGMTALGRWDFSDDANE